MLSSDGVFGLELRTAAGSEAEAEVRQPLARGAGNAQLRGAVLPARTRDRVARLRRRSRAEVRGLRALLLHRLQPDLVDSSLRPRREQAHAVSLRKDLVQVRVDRRPRKIL